MKKILFQRELVIPSTIEGFNSCLDVVDEIRKQFDLNFDTSFCLHTVIVESVENAFIHGNKGDRELEVRVFISINQTQIFVEVEDSGDGFDLDNVPHPISLEDLKTEGGRGIFFIKMLSSSCYTVGNGNIIRIIIDR